MIPKIIHYCWFGGNPKPEKLEAYINNWKGILLEYRFIEWNEDSFDIEKSVPYVKEAYSAHKYAFVSDYVRLYALNAYGGVYLDTDVELVKDFSCLLQNSNIVFCYESRELLATSFIATTPRHPIMEGFLETYNERKFEVAEGTYDYTTINQTLTDYLITMGIKIRERNHVEGDVVFYTSDYFSAQDVNHGHPYITKNTYAIHRFEKSWGDDCGFVEKGKLFLKYRIIRPCLQAVLGYKIYDKFDDWISGRKDESAV